MHGFVPGLVNSLEADFHSLSMVVAFVGSFESELQCLCTHKSTSEQQPFSVFHYFGYSNSDLVWLKEAFHRG